MHYNHYKTVDTKIQVWPKGINKSEKEAQKTTMAFLKILNLTTPTSRFVVKL